MRQQEQEQEEPVAYRNESVAYSYATTQPGHPPETIYSGDKYAGVTANPHQHQHQHHKHHHKHHKGHNHEHGGHDHGGHKHGHGQGHEYHGHGHGQEKENHYRGQTPFIERTNRDDGEWQTIRDSGY